MNPLVRERRAGRLGEAGASRVGCLLGVLVGIVAAYAGVQFIGTEIDFRSLSSEVQRVARSAGDTPDEAIRNQITTKVTELGLPQRAGAATIRRLPGNRIQIALSYPDTLSFFGRWEWVWTRRIDIDQVYTTF